MQLQFTRQQLDTCRETSLSEVEFLVQRWRVHAMNESYIADVQLRLHYSPRHGAPEAGQVGNLSRYEMASYIMTRPGIAANLRPAVMQPCAQAYGKAIR